MSRALIFSLLLLPSIFADSTPTCTVDGYKLVNNKCLKLNIKSVKHADAENACMNDGATLVNIRNAIDNRALATFIGTSASVVWIGLFCVDSSPDQCFWDDSTGSAKQYHSFSAGFPLADVGHCVSFSTQGSLAGKWLNVNCEDTLKGFVCELPTTIQEEYCDNSYNGYCYWLESSAQFSDAQYACEKRCGNLASIHSANENRYIDILVKKFAVGPVFIGAVQSSPNSFSWLDGTQWDYDNVNRDWSTGSACVGIESVGIESSPSAPLSSWRSLSCTASLQPLCKRPVGRGQCSPPPPPTVTPDPSNASNCNSTLVFAPGVITSPNYPNAYPPLICSYRLATVGTSRVSIVFTDTINISAYDSLKVYDSDGSLLSNVQGSRSPITVSATGNSMLVTFQSYQGSSHGFQAIFSALPV